MIRCAALALACPLLLGTACDTARPAASRALPAASLPHRPEFDPAALDALPMQTAQPNLEAATVRPLEHWTRLVSDAPRYFVWSISNGDWWIMSTGGPLGHNNWYGPMTQQQFDALIHRSPSEE